MNRVQCGAAGSTYKKGQTCNVWGVIWTVGTTVHMRVYRRRCDAKPLAKLRGFSQQTDKTLCTTVKSKEMVRNKNVWGG